MRVIEFEELVGVFKKDDKFYLKLMKDDGCDGYEYYDIEIPSSLYYDMIRYIPFYK